MNQTNSSTDLMIFLKKRIQCLEEANRALDDLRSGRLQGAAVLLP